MTYNELVDKIARTLCAMHCGNPDYDVWEAIGNGDRAALIHDARVMLDITYGVLSNPDKRMVNAAAKAMSPGKRPTQEWVSVGDKHAYRFMAMIEASPLKPQDTA